MVVVTLFRLSGDTGTYNQASQFTDVPSYAYYYNAVGWAVANGITSGANATEFKPTRIITWSEFFTFLYRYADYMGLSTAATESITGAPDYNDVGSWARTPISWAYTYGMLLRSSPYAYIYPNANLDRKTQALFIARFRRNVEGIVSDRDRFEFLNNRDSFMSSEDNIDDSRYLISDTDWNRLTSLANGSQSTLTALINARKKDWNGSCLGISLATALHAYGKINFSGTTTNGCSDLYSIPVLDLYLSSTHKYTTDTYYYPSERVTEAESKINMYQISQHIPSIADWKRRETPQDILEEMKEGQEHGGIGLFCYSHEDSSKCGGDGGTSAHAVLVYGRPINTSTGYKVMICDNNTESVDSGSCWIEVNTTTGNGVVVKKRWNAAGTYKVTVRQTIIDCKYNNDFEMFNSILDYDGPANSYYLNNRAEFAEDNTDELLSENKVQAIDTVTVNGESVSLVGKTILYIDCFRGFEIENSKGEKLQYVDGKLSGTMKTYGMNFIPYGEDAPCTYAFIVDDSTSFTCSNLSDSAKILSFSAYGENMCGNLMVDSLESVGYSSISIDSTGRSVGEQ